MEILIKALNSQLESCKFFVESKMFSEAEAIYNQAYGMVVMFGNIYPRRFDKAAEMWMKNYKSEFERIIYQ